MLKNYIRHIKKKARIYALSDNCLPIVISYNIYIPNMKNLNN